MGKKSIIEYNKTFEHVTDIIGKAVAVLPAVTSYVRSSGGGGGGGGGSTTGVITGAGLEPIKRLISLWESCGGDISKYNSPTCYNATNPTTTFPAKFGVDVETLTINQINNKTTGATGKYQFMPATTMKSVAIKVGLNPNVDKLTKANQEKMGDWLITHRAGDYIKGINSGNQQDLENAVLGLAQEWSALPTCRYRNNPNKPPSTLPVSNSVVTGFGNATYWGGTSTNPSNSPIQISEVVKALVKTRKNITGNDSFFIPPYAVLP